MSLKSKLKAGTYFAKTYITAMPRILYRSTLSLFVNPNGSQHFILQVLNAIDLESDDPILASADIADLL